MTNSENENVSAPDSAPSNAVGTPETWENVISAFSSRLQNVGFEQSDIPEPESAQFPVFLAEVQEKDSVLAYEITQALRRFRDKGRLPSSAAAASRERRRAMKQTAVMRTEGRHIVFDKRKAPLYGLAALAVTLVPLMYILSRPQIKNTPTAKTSPTTPKASTPETEQPFRPQTPTDKKPFNAANAVDNGVKVAENGAKSAVKAGQDLVSPLESDSGRASTPSSNTTASRPASSPASSPSVVTTSPTSSSSGSSYDTPTTTISPPVVAPPPVSSSRTASRPATSNSNIYRPVPDTSDSTPSFGSSLRDDSSMTAVENTPKADVVVPPASTPVTPVASASDTAKTDDKDKTSDSAQNPSLADSSSGQNSSGKATSKPGTGTANARNTGTAKVPDPITTLPSMKTPADAPFGSSINQRPDTTATAPAMLNTTAVTAPDVAVTSGLIYQRKRTTPVVKTTASTSAPTPVPATDVAAPEVAAASVPGSGLTFGAVGGDVKTAAPATAPAETPFGSDVTNPASQLGALGPFKNLQQVQGRLITSIYALTGGSVPVVVVTPDGGSFVGVGTINGQLARVDMTFRRYVAADGTVSNIDALAYTQEGQNLTQGVPANIVPIAPTLALDAAQNGASALQSAVQSALQSSMNNAPRIAIGDGASISGDALPPLWQILAGGVGKTFSLPTTTQSITRAAKVPSNTQMVVIVGLSGN